MSRPRQLEGTGDFLRVGQLKFSTTLYNFLKEEVLPDTGVDPVKFWQGFESIIKEFVPKNQQLLRKRDEFQSQLDSWHRIYAGQPHNKAAYKAFLYKIGYLLPEGNNFKIETTNVDAEIALQAGPQLVVPVMNARFSLNAANARWGSLYDAFYGTDCIPEGDGNDRRSTYNPIRGHKVVSRVKRFLDDCAPLKCGCHHQVSQYRIEGHDLKVELDNGNTTMLANPALLSGYDGPKDAPISIFLEHNGLQIEICINPETHVGREDSAGVHDIRLEAAVTTIQDCEDSVAAVDADDKTQVYRNWLGLMLGTLESTFEKDGCLMTRRLNPDRQIKTPEGGDKTLRGRSLMLIRNVGHLMTTPTILDAEDNEVPEGIMDAMVTSLIALHDLRGNGRYKNSLTGSIYIVKPKMHGPLEVAFTCDLFSKVEDILGLKPHTIKVGIMDEERRTTLNLKECIRVAKDRVVFINTGFLDRTGDEIHTSMLIGPMVPKGAMKEQPWIQAYEDWNVDKGLASDFKGRAQIGKGMWAMPNEMAKMLDAKIEHPMAGANTAWVPSPTAAVLHALHYHMVDVFERQEILGERQSTSIDKLLTIPFLDRSSSLSREEIQAELDNNAQGLLGYVVRWIDQGVGCSKVPDIHNIGLMEDRATLRISSQHICNWLLHGLCSKEQVLATLQRMAEIVDNQNIEDPTYCPMADNFNDSLAFQAACDLIFKGCEQPNGYTEPLLHSYRKRAKQRQYSLRTTI